MSDTPIPLRARIGLKLIRPWLASRLTEQKSVWEDSKTNERVERFHWGTWCALERLLKERDPVGSRPSCFMCGTDRCVVPHRSTREDCGYFRRSAARHIDRP